MLRLVKSEINIESLQFYEGGTTKPNKYKAFKSQFLIDETRFVYVDLVFTYPILNENRFVSLDYEYHTQDGMIFEKKSLKIELIEGTNSYTVSFRNGLEKFYCWSIGDYKVKIVINGKTIAVKSFSIIESKDSFLGKVKVNSFQFYQTSFINLTEKTKREYQTQFLQSDTGGIACEIDFSYPTLKMDRRLFIEQIIYYSGGEVLGKEQYEETLFEGSNCLKLELKYGTGKKGNWLSGKYKMEILLNGKFLGEKEFEIISNDVVYLPTLLFNSLNFFNSYDGEEKKNRKYKRIFSRETASFIFWEIQFSMTRLQKRKRVKVEFIYLKPDHTILASGKTFFDLERGWESAWYSYGWGYNEYGNWQKGMYTVTIKIDGKSFCEGNFEIVD